ncbi:GNAT family N-acetyltransferase [Psychromonas aquimarina]|uniref:GNAT family N-acetyltransferase n=1 Tax=Psychromonas aquimarina TaxID=444919 RepID=UPI0003F63B9C|nr:GNAT family N-acetyltransferase [Psychromonas aquimarina]
MSKVTTYYLEMKTADSLNEKALPADFEIQEAQIKQYQLNRFLYQFVGANWGWTDKLSLTDQQWQEYAEREDLRTWAAYYKGSIAGYYELEKQQDGDVEIAYFGLCEKFIGLGLGGPLLSHAVKSAWAWKTTKRVWVHTCTLDHKSALNNYQARGFKIYREEIN